jgi:hypothetical protein
LKAKDVSTIGHRGNGDYQIQIIENDRHFRRYVSLIKQVDKVIIMSFIKKNFDNTPIQVNILIFNINPSIKNI